MKNAIPLSLLLALGVLAVGYFLLDDTENSRREPAQSTNGLLLDSRGTLQEEPEGQVVEEQTSLQHLAKNERPKSAYNPLTNIHSMSNLAHTFDQNLAMAEGGSGESMFVIHEVILNCVLIGEAQSLEELTSSIQDPEFLREMQMYLGPLVKDCVYINAHKPQDVPSYWDWADMWLEDADANGSKIAKLSRLSKKVQNSGVFEEAEPLLSEALADKDHRALYIASSMYVNTTDSGMNRYDPYLLKGRLFHYLGCKLHPNCSEEVALEELNDSIPTSEMVLIEEGAAKYLRDPTSISASPYTTLEQELDR